MEYGSRIEDFHRLRDLGLLPRDGSFFPSLDYPPLTMLRRAAGKDPFDGCSGSLDTFDIYIHIPFCIRRCSYCHCGVTAGASEAEKTRYLSALEKEMRLAAERLGVERITARTVLVGGGTPTHLSPSQLDTFLATISSMFDLSACSQFIYESDPPNLLGPGGSERLRLLRGRGVHRLAIGIQSMDDSVLRSMGRPHDAVAAADSVRSALEAGFKVCTDFIYGYPGQTTDIWIKTLERAVGLEPHELHLYRLKIKAYGPWPSVIGSMYAADPCAFPSIEETLRMKAAAIAFLARKGYRENLTRVFTRSREDYSRFMENHSSGTLNLLAFGLSASSSFVDRVWVNARDLGMYYSMIETGRLPVADFLERDRDTLTRYAIVLPLKNRGVRKKVFQSLAGVPLDSVFRAKIGRLKDYGLVREDSQSLTLTPLGRFFADEVCHQFHTPDCMPFPRSAYSEGPLNPYNDPMP